MSRLLEQTREVFRQRQTGVDEVLDNRGRVRTSRRAEIEQDPKLRYLAQRRLRILRRHRFNRDALITVPQELSELTIRQMEAVAPALTQAMVEHMVPVARQADEDWPVDTGLSRSLLQFVFERRGDERFRATFGQAADYAWYIKFRRKPERAQGSKAPRAGLRGQHVWTSLVRQPAERAADRVVDAVGDDLVTR